MYALVALNFVFDYLLKASHTVTDATGETWHTGDIAETAADLMTRNPVSISDTATIREAIAVLADRGFSAAPVIDKTTIRTIDGNGYSPSLAANRVQGRSGRRRGP